MRYPYDISWNVSSAAETERLGELARHDRRSLTITGEHDFIDFANFYSSRRRATLKQTLTEKKSEGEYSSTMLLPINGLISDEPPGTALASSTTPTGTTGVALGGALLSLL